MRQNTLNVYNYKCTHNKQMQVNTSILKEEKVKHQKCRKKQTIQSIVKTWNAKYKQKAPTRHITAEAKREYTFNQFQKSIIIIFIIINIIICSYIVLIEFYTILRYAYLLQHFTMCCYISFDYLYLFLLFWSEC